MGTTQNPWESLVSRLQEESTLTSSSRGGMPPGRNVLGSNAPQLSSHPMGSVRARALPPLPPRPTQLSMFTTQPARPAYGVAPSMYGGYSGYSGYGGYSSYGSYPGNMYMPGGYGYGSYGHPSGAFENRFLQAAEESSRGAFQSIESLVRTFTSVSMMLESTYHAMYSSFRAILGVVDNFSRLRQMFAQFISAITILRLIQNFYRRLLYWLGIIDYSPQTDQVWNSVSAASSSNQVANYSSWPLFTFIGFLFGGPYLISKLFSSNTKEPKTWDLGKGFMYKACYPHEAASEAELSFVENEMLNVAPPECQLPDSPGWLLATNRQGKVGYVPVTRLSAQPSRMAQRPVPTSSSGVEPSIQTKDHEGAS